MGIYEDLNAPGQAIAPGSGAVTDTLDLPGSAGLPQLPELTQQMFDQMVGGATARGTTTTTGGVDRGPAMHDLPAASGRAGKILSAAKGLLGTPYVWGGTSSSGIDCSGLVQAAYKAAGIDLPRISYQQANAGRKIGIRQLQAGDLVAWDNSPRNPGADHIAIYVGNGEIIEAAHPGTRVRIRRLGRNEGAWGVRIGG